MVHIETQKVKVLRANQKNAKLRFQQAKFLKDPEALRLRVTRSIQPLILVQRMETCAIKPSESNNALNTKSPEP